MKDYKRIKDEVDKYYDEELGVYNIENIPEDIEKARLYELVLNILNNKIDGYIYKFKQCDIDFVLKYNINMENFMNKFMKL